MHSILIADSHNLCREALCNYVRYANPDYHIEGVPDYKSLALVLENESPDLILIDMDLHGWKKDASENEMLRQSGIKIGLILPLMQTQAMWNDGIAGVFPKSLSCKAFISGISDILEGRTFFPSIKENQQVFELSGSARKSIDDFHLTMREKEVLGHLVKGASNKDIARALDLQVVTVKLHVRGICRKMKATNRTQAALMAKEHGWG